jgi:hypothetical protein
MFDIQLIRLAYEILGISAEDIAEQLGLVPRMVYEMIDKYNWKPWFPKSASDFFLVDANDLEEGEDLLSVRIDQYSDQARKRLEVYTLAKELALAHKYLSLELSIMQKTADAIAEIDIRNTASLKLLSSIYTDMTKKHQSGTSLLINNDENGLPQVVIKDLSGL